MRKIVFAMIILFAAVFLTGCDDWFSSNESPADKTFHNASVLEPSVLKEMKSNFADNMPGATVNDVSCVEHEDRDWLCLVDYDDPDSLAPGKLVLSVTVSPDYDNWISHPVD